MRYFFITKSHLYYIDFVLFQVAALRKQLQPQGQAQQVQTQSVTQVYAFKHNKVLDWSKFIDTTRKFKIGEGNAFSSAKSRYEYIRILINYFTTNPSYANISFEKLFDPENGYAIFQSLLNACPVPADHEGFYLHDAKKKDFVSPYLTSP